MYIWHYFGATVIACGIWAEGRDFDGAEGQDKKEGKKDKTSGRLLGRLLGIQMGVPS